MSILSNIFKSETKENWKQLALEIDADFVDGGIWDSDKVVLNYGKTKIVLCTHSINTGKSNTKYTRMKSQFTSKNGLTFSISSENFFTHLVKKIGFNDVEIGEFEFDDKMYIKSNNKQKVKSFLDSSIVKENVFKVVTSSESVISIKRHDSLFLFTESDSANPFYVVLTKLGVESDIEILKQWFTLCKLTLDRLIAIEEAEDIDPNIQ
jgi:hypothetical protein